MTTLDDPSRLRLATADMLDLRPDKRLQACVEQAATLAETRIAAVSFVLQTIVLFRAHQGFATDLAATRAVSRGTSFCRLVVERDGPVVIPDALQDPRVASELVQGHAIGSYVGVPIRIHNGVLGVLSVMDCNPRKFDPWLHRGLSRIARTVAELLICMEARNPLSRCERATIHVSLREEAVITAGKAVARLHTAVRAAERLSGTLSLDGARQAAFEILDTEDVHTSLRSALRAIRTDLMRSGMAGHAHADLDEKLALAELSLAEAEPWMRLARALLSGYLDVPRAARAARAMRESLGFHGILVEVMREVTSFAGPQARSGMIRAGIPCVESTQTASLGST